MYFLEDKSNESKAIYITNRVTAEYKENVDERLKVSCYKGIQLDF